MGGWTKNYLDEEIDLPASYTFSIQADQDQSHSTHAMPSVIQSVRIRTIIHRIAGSDTEHEISQTSEYQIEVVVNIMS